MVVLFSYLQKVLPNLNMLVLMMSSNVARSLSVGLSLGMVKVSLVKMRQNRSKALWFLMFV